jgi:hypothetical protein
VIFIKREYIDAPEQGEEALPEAIEAANLFGAESKRPKRFNLPIVLPNL